MQQENLLESVNSNRVWLDPSFEGTGGTQPDREPVSNFNSCKEKEKIKKENTRKGKLTKGRKRAPIFRLEVVCFPPTIRLDG